MSKKFCSAWTLELIFNVWDGGSEGPKSRATRNGGIVDCQNVHLLKTEYKIISFSDGRDLSCAFNQKASYPYERRKNSFGEHKERGNHAYWLFY